MVQLKTLGLTYHHAKKTAYVLVLGEVGGKRRIPIVIGTAEAQSIALAMRGLPFLVPWRMTSSFHWRNSSMSVCGG